MKEPAPDGAVDTLRAVTTLRAVSSDLLATDSYLLAGGRAEERWVGMERCGWAWSGRGVNGPMVENLRFFVSIEGQCEARPKNLVFIDICI